MSSSSSPALRPPIAIIGAGPCGLMLAVLLERKGIPYVVFERDTHDNPYRAGGSLDIHPSTGQRALRAAGLFDQFRKLARYEDDVFRVFGPRGGEEPYVMGPPEGEEEEGQQQQNGTTEAETEGNADTNSDNDGDKNNNHNGEDDARPEIDRGVLRTLLLSAIPEGRIRWSHGLVGITQAEETAGPLGRTLHFANGETASGFRLIAGTDGAWSKVRTMLTDAIPIYTTRHYVEARIVPSTSNGKPSPAYAHVSSLAGAGTTTAMGPGGRQIVLQRQGGDGHYRAYLGFRSPTPDWLVTRYGGGGADGGKFDLSDDESCRALFLRDEFFGTWDERWTRVVEGLEQFRQWPLYALPTPLVWEKKTKKGETGGGGGEEEEEEETRGLTLLGDAAHLATPNGEGVNIAMLDALELSEGIAGADAGSDGEGFYQAVERFEKKMLKRGEEHIHDGHKMGEVMWADENPKTFIDFAKSMFQG